MGSDNTVKRRGLSLQISPSRLRAHFVRANLTRQQQARKRPAAPGAFASAADRVISLPFCAVRGWSAFGNGRHWRGAAWPDR